MTLSAPVGGSLRILYAEPHELTGLLEVFVLDVYDVRKIPRGALVLDLGAGVGDFAVHAGRRVGPSGRVISVEVHPEDLALLDQNVRAAGLTNVRSVAGFLGESGERRSFARGGSRVTSVGVTFEELLGRAGLAVTDLAARPVVVKVDIEGAEVDVVPRIAPYLDRISSVAIELHGTHAAVDAVLGPAGFRFERITRGTYLARSLAFALRHPNAAVGLWRRYRATREYADLRKIARGIDIASSPDLAVGVYRRRAPLTGPRRRPRGGPTG